jgi:AcrR family transcriptional regulator
LTKPLDNPVRSPRSKLASPDSGTALLDAARAIFETEGVKGVSVRRVAQGAGCTTMAVYSRFQGKDGILGALFDEGFDKLASAQQAIDPALTNADRLLALCHAYRATAHGFPHHYALMLGHFSGELVPSVASSAKALATLDHLAQAVAAMPSMKRKSRRASVEVANRLFAFCHGWVSLERMHFFADNQRNQAAFDRAVMALAQTGA